MSDVVGDSVLELVRRLWTSARVPMQDALLWLAQATTPEERIELSDQLGRRFSGCVMMDRGRVVAMIAVEASRSATSHHSGRSAGRRGPFDLASSRDPYWDPDMELFDR